MTFSLFNLQGIFEPMSLSKRLKYLDDNVRLRPVIALTGVEF